MKFNGTLLVIGSLAALLISLSGCRSLSAPQGVQLAENGAAQAVIVIPKNASPPVRFAASELQEYLEQITGSDFQIVEVLPKDGPAIVLGAELAEQAGLSLTGLKRDGFVIQCVGESIHIAGHDDATAKSSILLELKEGPDFSQLPDREMKVKLSEVTWDFERGTLYGVYGFLELLGVRWFLPTNQGEVVPARPTLVVPPIAAREEPSFELRHIFRQVALLTDRSIKLGIADPKEFEELGLNARNQILWNLRQRVSSKWMAFNHRPGKQAWGRRFSKTHPEYFALLKDGQRGRHLNYTSAGMLEETMRDMDAFFSGLPAESRGIPPGLVNRGWHPAAAYGDTFSLLPDDGLRVDHSPESQQYIREDLELPYRHTNYIWQFVDQAARRLKERHPDKFITCLAYQSYFETPDPRVVERLPDNVIVGIAALSGPSSLSRRYAQAGEKERMVDLLERWSKVTSGDRPFLFWNYWLYRMSPSQKDMPMILPHLAQDFVQTQARYGKYVFIQMISRNWAMEHLNKYVMYRLLWNPNLDLEALLDDYCEKYYGAAGAEMREFFRILEDSCLDIAANGSDMVRVWEGVYSPQRLERLREFLADAEKRAKGTYAEDHVQYIKTWIFDKLVEGRVNYIENIAKLKERGEDISTSYRIGRESIVIDGKVDVNHDNRAWHLIGRGRPMRNNANGRHLKRPAWVRIRHSDERLYFCFVMDEANFKEMVAKDRKDYIEIFLDANNDRDTYHWLYVNAAGEIIEKFHPGPGEPPLDWNSQAEVAIAANDTQWVVEIAIPLSAVGLRGKELESLEIGALCGLTRWQDQGSNDFFGSSNPILRGSFHQPNSFGRIRFVRRDGQGKQE